MKKISLFSILIAGALSFSSCNKWLDVQPNSQVKESELFKTEAGFKEALAGTYTILADNALYGKELTYGMMGVLSHEWLAFPLAYNDDGNYNYTAALTQTRIDAVWANMYKALVNANNILGNIDAQNVFTGDNYKIIKGEALALRAFIHFDLLRCFGAAYTINANQPAIPYVTKYTSQQTAQSNVKEVVDKVVADLLAAKELLKVDPIFTGRKVGQIEDNGYLLNRQLHLNYYAVEGLLARIYLYTGNYAQARTSANAVISSGRFSFATQDNVIKGIDRSGAPEHLFGLQVTNLTQNSVNYLSQEGTGVFSIDSLTLFKYYENNTDDYRYLYLFQSGVLTAVNTKYLLKYAESTSTSEKSYYQNKIPLLKLSEIYYILAECDYHDNISVLGSINPVRKARGLVQLTVAPADVRALLTSEFRKDFIGEGQLFYYFKRLNQAIVPNSDKNLPALKAYIFPLPTAELDAANRVSNR